MMKRTIKSTLLITIGTLVILILGASIFIVFPSVKYILDLRTRIIKTENYLENQYEKTKHLRRSVRSLGEAASSTEDFTVSAIHKEQNLDVILELEDLVKKNNIIQQSKNVLFVDKKDPLFKENKGGLQEPFYIFSFLNRGRFVDQLNFLKALEKLPYYVVIDTLHFESKKVANGPSEVLLQFDGKIYIVPPNL